MTDWRTAKVHPGSLPVRFHSVHSTTCGPGRKWEVRARQQTWCASRPGKTDQGPPAPGSRRQITGPRRNAQAERLPLGAPEQISAVMRHRDRPWQPMPMSHGPLSMEAQRDSSYENATPLSADAACRRALSVDLNVRRLEPYSSRPWSRRTQLRPPPMRSSPGGRRLRSCQRP